MHNSQSFPTMLFNALKDDKGTNRDPELICQSLFHNFFKEACKLVLRNYPTSMSIPEMVARRIYCPTLTNEDFNIFILTLFLQNHDGFLSEQGFLFMERIPTENLNFALLIAIFELRNSEDLDSICLFDKLEEYFPKLEKFKPSSEFFSITVLQKQLFSLLEEKTKALNLKKTKPSKEFFLTGDRESLKNYANKFLSICSNFTSLNLNDTAFYSEIDQAIKDFDTGFSQAFRRGNDHFLSLAAKEEVKIFINNVSNSAKNVVDNFLQKALNATDKNDVKELLNEIQQYITSPRTIYYQEAFFIAELIGILNKKKRNIRKQKKFNQILTLFGQTISNFESDFKKMKKFPEVYSYCITYPTQRNDFLRNKETETSKCLEYFGKSLKYLRYISMAAVVDSACHLERVCAVRSHDTNHNALKYEQLLNLRFIKFLELDQLITNLLKKFRGIPLVNFPIQDLTLDASFPQFKFDSALCIDDLSVADVETIYKQKIELVSIIPTAIKFIDTAPKCANCKEMFATRICGKCNKFVCCSRCALNGCPLCNHPLPNL